MRSLICFCLVALFATQCEAQLLRRFRYCPPQQQDIITIQPPAAPVSPEVPYMNIQAIPQPVPIPMPQPQPQPAQQMQTACNDGANLTQLIMMHAMMSKAPEVYANTEALKMMMLMKGCDNVPAPPQPTGEHSQEILSGLIQALVAKKQEQVQPAPTGEHSQEIMAALIQALVQKKAEGGTMVIQPVPTQTPAQSNGVSCESLLKMLMNK